MLTATEKARAQKFTSGMDEQTADAMTQLFIITKPGDNKDADELIAAAHQKDPSVSTSVANYLKQFGLVKANGSIPKAIAASIREAVRMQFLTIGSSPAPTCQPSSPAHE